ncbi:HdeD family acid-resistance protein [Rhodoferax koreense]|nr:HdeD family acid-resistance protein [Rhodoferax koreense]
MQTDYFLTQMGRQWKWLVLRGLVAMALGLLGFVMPGQTLQVLALCWGVYAFVDGFIALLTAYQIRERNRPWWSMALVGVVGVAAGLVSFIWPVATAVSLLLFIAVWAVLMGLFQIVTALRMRKSIQGEWMLVASGLISVLFGAAMIAAPAAGALAVVWLIAAYALVFGFLLVCVGLRLRGIAKMPWEPPVVTRPAGLSTRPAPLSEPKLDR